MSNQQVDNNNLERGDSSLPGFMSENSKINYNDEAEHGSWLSNNLTKLMISISILWFVIVLIYITQFFGWSNLFLMMPDEFGGFLAGVTLPLAIIWVVMAYIDRGTSFKNEAKFLRAYMNQLVYPEDGGANTAKAMADAIRSQVVELHEVTKYATAQTEIIKKELGARVNDFAKLVNTLDTYSSKTIVELSEGVKTLVENFDYVTDRAQNSTQTFKGYISDFSTTTAGLENNCSNLFNKIVPHIQELKSSSQLLQSIADDNNSKMAKSNEALIEFGDRASKSVANVTQILDSQTSRLEDVARDAVSVCDDIYKKIDDGVSKIDEVLRGQSDVVESYLVKLDDQADNLAIKFSDHSSNIALEVDKVITRSNLIEETVAVQVNQLQGVSEEICGNIKGVENRIEKSVSILEDKSAAAVGAMQEIVSNTEKSTVKLNVLSEQSLDRLSSVSNDIKDRNDELQKVSDNVVLNLKLLMQELGSSTLSLKEQADLSKEQLENVGGVVKKHTDDLCEATSLVVAQSKVGENALVQQQKNIASSVNRIEEIKTELKYQIDELTRSASYLTQEAETTVVQLKKQMDDTLNSCNEVVAKTQMVNNNLNEQAGVFDNVADQALGKVVRLEGILNNQSIELDKISQVIVERSTSVADSLEKQAANINVATQNSDNTFKQISGAFSEQSNILGNIAENTVNHVANVVQVLDEKAENISLLFKQQENEFFNICDRLSENTDNMGNNLKKQVAVIEQNADKVFARMTLLEDDVNKRVEAVVANSVKSIDKLSEVNQSITNQNNDVSNFIKEITDKLALISNTFSDNFQIFNNTVRDLTLSSDDFTNSILGNCDKINIANQNLTNESKNATIVLDIHAKNIDETLIRTISQTDLVKDSFEHQREILTDIANTVATQTRLGEASLAQQYKYLSDTSTEVAQRVNEINSNFKSTTDNIFETSAKIAYEFNVLGDRLLKVNDDINKSSRDSIKNVEQVNLSLSQIVEDLGSNVNSSSNKINNVMRDYEKYIANFNTITAEASSGVFEINNLISSQSDKMIKISEDTKQLVECFNTVLNDTSVQLANRANMAYDKVKGLGENLKVLSMQMEESTKMSSTHFENSSDKLRATIGEIATNAERISNEIRSSGEVFLKQSDVLVVATDDTLKKVGDVMGILSASTNEFSNRGDEVIKKSISFSDIINKQLKILTETSQKAENKLGDLEKRYEGIRVDTFLKDASYIIEKLETASVDINRIFNPAAEEEIWKKYYNGDSAAFVRYLAKTMTKQQIVAIRTEFEKNLEFRTMVTRYLSEFETLITKARTNERSGILLSVISGADIGKVYYILAKALDKLN